jgi:hypothetical protein
MRIQKTVNFHGEKRSNETPESKTDPDSRLARKSGGKESRLSYSGNLFVENRNGRIVDAEVFQSNGTAERDAALVMMERLPGTHPLTVGGDKGFDTFGFVEECRHLRVRPHVAQNLGRRGGGSAIDGRTTRHSGYALSQKKRKRIEECFGWLKTIALMRKVRHRGVSKVHWIFNPGLCRLQSGTNAKPGGRSSGDVSRGGGVSPAASSEKPRPQKHRKSKPFDIINDEQRKEEPAASQFFSSLLV